MTRNVASTEPGLIDRAVSALTEAWDPPRPQAADSGAEDEWEGDECGCGGEDSYGRPYCNCHDSCNCDQCNHHRHTRRRFCAAKDCAAKARQQVKAWVISHHSVQAKDINPDLTPETGGDEWVDLDEIPSYTWSKPVCSYRHAEEVIDHDRGWREKPGQERRMWYEVTQFRYEPDYLDLPEILAELREVGRSLQYGTAELARAGCQHTVADAFDPGMTLESARRSAARLVRTLAVIETQGRQIVLPGQDGDDDD